MKNIVILGSTGSIGKQSLKVIKENNINFYPFALVAGNNVKLLIEQSLKFMPKYSIIANESKYNVLKEALRETEIIACAGENAINDIISHEKVEIVLGAISGFIGLKFILKAIEFNKRIALANKEALVAGGNFIINKIKRKKINIIPIDSEHSAIYQCLKINSNYKKIILTSSGGPFRDFKKEEFRKITRKLALKNPNWSMGKKITIDSATLVNKGLEVIEAHYLFDCSYDKIEVLIHKESIIHSMVELEDTSILAQLGYPDMRIPILYSLSYPNRIKTSWKSINFLKIKVLNFDRPKKIFKALRLAYSAGREGGSAPIIYNSANEIAVNLFLKNRISFLDIFKYIDLALEKVKRIKINSYESILAVDKETRKYLLERIL